MGSILADPGQWQCKRPQTRPSLRPVGGSYPFYRPSGNGVALAVERA